MTLQADRRSGGASLWARWVMDRRRWWLPLAAVLLTGAASLLFVGARTYRDAPPIPDFTRESGELLVPAASILRGQAVFQRHALMDYGSLFGDGAARGHDYTADALHEVAVAMLAFHRARAGAGDDGDAAARARVQQEIRRNRFDPATARVPLSAAQAHAYEALAARYTALFRSERPDGFAPAGSITDAGELRDLASFFFWGAWVCGAERPGTGASYTHDWPYDELAGNRPGPAIVLWSAAALLALLAVLGAVLFLHGRYGDAAGWRPDPRAAAAASPVLLDAYRPTPVQRASYAFFVAAALLFALQVFAGVLTIHDFLHATTVFGVDFSRWIPLPVTRGWHLQLALLWIASCWIGASIFVLPFVGGAEPRGQRALVHALFALLVVVVAGSLAGIALGPLGRLGAAWNLLGNQGWEFVEAGRAWQAGLLLAFVLWAAILARALAPAWRSADAWVLPKWLLYVVVCVIALFSSAFVSTPETNFVIADFWRWSVVHMWGEAFFEVLATVLLAHFMLAMGFVGAAAASRVVYLSALLFLGSGLLGISHNFYWNAKPVATLAIGSVFSTLQVVPLLLLTLEAWQVRGLPREALRRAGPDARAGFGHDEAFLFLLAVNFWNFLGAGVFGFLVNLPIVNYYEHGTYLTVNHGHAALMGVYGNLALGSIVFCSRTLVRPDAWRPRLLRRAFWSVNAGLGLMVALDLFPAGVAQLVAVLERGLWSARSPAFVDGALFQTLTWARAVGGAVFVFGGVLPLTWFVVSRSLSLRAAASSPDRHAAPRSARDEVYGRALHERGEPRSLLDR